MVNCGKTLKFHVIQVITGPFVVKHLNFMKFGSQGVPDPHMTPLGGPRGGPRGVPGGVPGVGFGHKLTRFGRFGFFRALPSRFGSFWPNFTFFRVFRQFRGVLVGKPESQWGKPILTQTFWQNLPDVPWDPPWGGSGGGLGPPWDPPGGGLGGVWDPPGTPLGGVWGVGFGHKLTKFGIF